ncbi:MAG: 2-amino-4-hydroxy-6-hydroxymethyldihydropteridine diphosphokinase [Alphaproteobacteria bacterium]|nr:2-amino-4-hydroxy-6-hydroxymethyldihydropteridine diphosphokinase [Alphaproteobacteria bacterium]
MILIGLGSNLPAPPAATPLETARAALAALPEAGITLVKCSGWYESEPVPRSDQPWFVNAVASVSSALRAPELLGRLLALEQRFGRARSVPNAARTLDLDLLDCESQLCDTPTLTLPHPRMHERRFVLAPLCEIAPEWRHPRFALSAVELLARVPPEQQVRRLDA